MKLFKQKEIMNPLYCAKLDNEVNINVFGDYAVGSDGNVYYHVGREVDGVLVTVGWSYDVDTAVVID